MNTKLGKLSEAYDMAKSKPMVHVHVFHGGTMGDDTQWRKKERVRKVQAVKALKGKIDNFDREKAADAVLSSLMREHKQAQLDLERLDSGGYDGEAL